MTATANFDGFLPEGETLKDFQNTAVAYALVATAEGRGTWIADEQGLGKTRTSIVTAKVFDSIRSGNRTTLVVVKDALKANWQAEYARCAPELEVQVLQGRSPYEPINQVCIIGLSVLVAWKDQILAHRFDNVIFDESHYLKNGRTQWTQAAIDIAKDIRGRRGLVLLLTGTPLLNKPLELMTQLLIMGRLQDIAPRPHDGKSWGKSFQNTFCDRKWNGYAWVSDGNKNPALLQSRLRGNCMIRRLRKEVLNMTETQWIQEPRSLNGGLDRYRNIERTFVARHPASATLELLTKLRMAAGLAKIPTAIEWIMNYREENPGHKLVVFAWHVEVQEAILAALVKADVPALNLKVEKDKGRAYQAEQAFNHGNIEVMVCSLQANREGHTLIGDGDNVNTVLFVEQPWHPGACSQAADRISRIGQNVQDRQSVTLIAPDTTDVWLADLIAKKWDTFRKVVDGTLTGIEGEEEDIQRLMQQRLRQHMMDKYGTVEPGRVD